MLSPLGRSQLMREAIYTNASPDSITPTLGAELMTNSDFSAWTADNPDGWTVSNETGATREVTERDSGQLHADSMTVGGAANIFASGASSPILRQDIISEGRWYKRVIVVSAASPASPARVRGITSAAQSLPSAGTYTRINRCMAGFAFNVIDLNNIAGEATLDSNSIKELTALLIQQHSHNTPLSYNQCGLTIAADTQAGVYARHAGSGDYVLAYADRALGRAYLIKSVSSTVNEINNAVITYAAGKVLKLKHHQTDGWQVFYDTAINIDSASAIITTTTVTDTNLDACDEDGLFSTDSSTTFADYKWSPN